MGDQHEPLLELVTRSADPDLALAGLDRLSDEVPALPDRLVANPVLARQLIMVLGASTTLAQHLVAHPEQLDLLEPELAKASATDLRAELLRSTGADPAEPLPVATDLTGDGAADRLPRRPAADRRPRPVLARSRSRLVDEVADELSDLADATLEAALAIARRQARPATRCTTRLAVVGARQVRRPGTQLRQRCGRAVRRRAGARRRPVSRWSSNDRAITVATRMAAELTRICSAHTAAGTIWEVDAALRPEGKAGQLVRTLASHRVYYEKWAKTWEFQAMLKARPVRRRPGAGPGVRRHGRARWSGGRPSGRTSSPTPRRCASGSSPTSPPGTPGRELKLGEGGLRDVEFSVQLLQLVHGRVDERLRTRATLPALKALVDNGYVGREDGKGFALAYRFLRTLEHRIQLFSLRRTHVLPDGRRRPAPARSLARLRRPGEGAADHLAARLPAGPAAARAALLLPAARRGGPDPVRASCG